MVYTKLYIMLSTDRAVYVNINTRNITYYLDINYGGKSNECVKCLYYTLTYISVSCL
jgi:hypothetical protein